MSLTNTVSRYGAIPQLLHWSVVVLLIAQFLLAEATDELPEGAEQLAMLARHRSVGLTILGIALLRVLWRIFDRPPPLPAMPPWQRLLALTTHWGMYVLLFSLPLTGWIMSSADGDAVSWFGLLQLPELVLPSESLHDVLHEVHETLAVTLLWFAGLHVAAALKHQFVDRDGLLLRMLPWGRRGRRD